MRHLWFRQCYVDPILTGVKTSTIRRGWQDIPPGSRLLFSVGPRRPFALVTVTDCDHLSLEGLTETERDAVAGLYPGELAFTRLSFHLLPIPDAESLVTR